MDTMSVDRHPLPFSRRTPMSATIEKPAKVLYTAKTHTTGGRTKGVARSSDGRLEVKLSVPGGPGDGTNPEQLFAAGWAACCEGARAAAAREMKVARQGGSASAAEAEAH